MPGFVLDALAMVFCSHGGKAEPTLPSPRVTMMGRPVVTQPPPYVVVGCLCAPPCVSAAFLTGSLRVTSMGQPVLLTTSHATTIPNAVPLVITPGQTRVKAQ